MKLTTFAIAICATIGAAVVSVPAQAQPRGPDRQQVDRRDHGDRGRHGDDRGRNWDHGRRWDHRGHGYGWDNRRGWDHGRRRHQRYCRWVWRHHHRVRICRYRPWW